METGQKSNLESKIAAVSGFVTGAGTTALACYAPELTPYVAGAAGAAAGAAAAGATVKNPAKFVAKFLTYGALSSALVLGGNYLGRNTEEVHSATIPNATNEMERIVLQSRDKERTLYKYQTNEYGNLFLPRGEILRIEAVKAKTNATLLLEREFEKYR